MDWPSSRRRGVMLAEPEVIASYYQLRPTSHSKPTPRPGNRPLSRVGTTDSAIVEIE